MGEEKKGKKKAGCLGTAIKGILIFILLVAILFVIIGIFADTDGGTSDNRANFPNISKDEFINSCEELNYKDIMRNPEDFTEKLFHAEYYIDEALDQSGTTYYRGYLMDEDGYADYDTMAWIIDYRDENSDDYFKILDEDKVTVYGMFPGLTKTENGLSGAVSEDMEIDMKYAELISE